MPFIASVVIFQEELSTEISFCSTCEFPSCRQGEATCSVAIILVVFERSACAESGEKRVIGEGWKLVSRGTPRREVRGCYTRLNRDVDIGIGSVVTGAT